MSAGRPRDSKTIYRMYGHAVGKYVYAATQGYFTDAPTGKAQRRVMHWGRLTADKRFMPNEAYMALSPEDRREFVFPEDWDLTEVRKLPSERGKGRPSAARQASDRLYGATWMIDQLADKLGVTKDLIAAFQGNQERARDALTLAMYLLVTAEPFSHLAEWQDLEWYPAVRRLTPSAITRFLKTITDAERLEFTDLRRGRLGKETLCAVDTTTRSSRGNTLPDVAVGKSKDGGCSPQTTEVVVYSLSTHEPVFYQTLPGNVPDSKSLPVILKDLHQAGYRNLVLVTDRGYECQRTLELCILRRQKLLTAANVDRSRILQRIRELDSMSGQPTGMDWMPEEEVFCRQYELEMQLHGRGGKEVSADKLRLNLYFDPVVRARKLVELQNTLAEQEEGLRKRQKAEIPVPDSECRLYRYFRVKRSSDDRIESWTLDEKKVSRAQETFGFFANITLGLDFSAPTALRTYAMRDEQEKYFFSMKTRIDCDLQRNWSEKARRGARFIEFIALILISWIRHRWSSSEELRKHFKYVHAMILTMRQIHLIERPGKDKCIPPFLKKQMLVCEQFGIKVSDECADAYTSVEIQPKRKRGRPKKAES